MNERIKMIREYYKLTQDEFGKRIGSARNTIANYESGNRSPSNSVVLSICREFNVNEEWLRNGTGEMFRAEEENSIIAKATMLLGEKDPLFEAFIDTYSKLTPKNRELLYQFITDFSQSLADKKKRIAEAIPFPYFCQGSVLQKCRQRSDNQCHDLLTRLQ